MFGRKQSSFTLGNRLAAAHDREMGGLEPAPEGPSSEVPPSSQRFATPRPDPSTYFPPVPDQAPSEDETSLLKLGEAQTVSTEGSVSAPSAPPAAPKRRAGRAKTRLLGVDHAQADVQVEDVLASQAVQEAFAPLTYHAVGWLVVVDGPGRGHSMPLRGGVSQLGRGDDQPVQLNFGDSSISRSNHASIAFDEEKRGFFIGHGGKANLVRLNGTPVLSTEPVAHGDKIRIGETTLQLVAFCGDEFTWADGFEMRCEVPDSEADTPSEGDA